MKKILNFHIVIILLAWSCHANALRDPTRPPNDLLPVDVKVKLTGPFTVTAIFTYENGRKALISGDLLEVGDTINSYTITKIGSDTVELKKPEEPPLVLKLLPEVKQARQSSKGS